MERDDESALEQFKAVVESVRDYALFLLDAEGRVKTWNTGAQLLKGYAPAEVIGKPNTIFFPPEDQVKARALLEIAATLGRAEDEGWRVKKDGTKFWASVVLTATRDQHGRHTGFVKVTRDLTEKKISQDQMIAALSEARRSEQVYSTLAGNIPHALVALFDRELRCLAIDGGMARSDPAAQALCGKHMRELGGEYSEETERAYRRALEGESSTLDYPLGERILELHTAPVRNSMGQVTLGLVLALDKTGERQNEQKLRRNEQVYRAIVQHMPNGAILMVDQNLRFVAADGPVVNEMLALATVKEIVGHTVDEIIAGENRERLTEIYRSALRGERRHHEMSGRGRHFDLNTVPIFDGDRITHGLAFIYDVTERKREADNAQRARALLESTLMNIADGVVLLDSERRVILANDAFATLFELPRDQIVGMTNKELVPRVAMMSEEPAMFSKRILAQQTASQDFVFVRPRRRVMQRSIVPVALPQGDGFLVTWRDVTAEKELLLERERQSLSDVLTGIPNRRAAEKALLVEHERAKRTGLPVSVAIFDIDHFKRINDQFGHAAGDEVLRQVAETLSRQARMTDLVARWGGEEFLAVLQGKLEGAKLFCDRARRSIEQLRPARVDKVTISIGVAELDVNEGVAAAISRADERLYEAKKAGRNQVK